MFGVVSDASGAVVPGVRVTLSDGRAEEEVVTDEVGNYRFVALPAGQYSLTAQLPNFTTYHQPRLQIAPNQSLRQNIALAVGQISQSVVVSVAGTPPPPVPTAVSVPAKLAVPGAPVKLVRSALAGATSTM